MFVRPWEPSRAAFICMHEHKGLPLYAYICRIACMHSCVAANLQEGMKPVDLAPAEQKEAVAEQMEKAPKHAHAQ